MDREPGNEHSAEAIKSTRELPARSGRIKTDDAGIPFVSPLPQLSPADWVSAPSSPEMLDVCNNYRPNQAPSDAHPIPPTDFHHLGSTEYSGEEHPAEPFDASHSLHPSQPLPARRHRSTSPANASQNASASLHSASITELSVTSISAATSPSFVDKLLPPAAQLTPACMAIAPPTDRPSPKHRTKQPRHFDTAITSELSTREFSAASTTRSRLTYLHSVPPTAEEQRSNVQAYIATVLAVLAICAVLVAILLIAVPPDGLRVVCTSTSCAALETLLSDSVDRSEEPCRNFYAYVCHGWGRSQSLSVYHSHVRRFLEEVERLLDPWPEARTADRAVIALYQSCVSVLVGGAEELAAFRDELQRCGVSWPGVSRHPDVVLTAARVYDRFRVAALLRIRRLSVKGATGDMLEVSHEGFLPAWRITRGQLLREGVYEHLFEETKDIYAANSSLAEDVLQYDQFLNLETLILANLAQRECRMRNFTFTGRVDGLPTVTRNIVGTTWRTAATTLGLSDSAQVLVTDLDYLKTVDQLLHVVNEQRLHYYLGWCVVIQMGRYIDKTLTSSWYKADSLALSDSPERRARAYCVQLAENLVGPLAFRRFVLVNGDADWTYVSSMTAAVTRQLLKKVSTSWAQDSGIGNFQMADLNITSLAERVRNTTRHEDTLMVLDRALEEWEITNKSSYSLLNNWVAIAAALSKVDATFQDQIRTTYVRNLLQNEWYNLLDTCRGTLSLPPLLATLPVYRRHLNDAAKYGTLGTLIATASLRVLLARIDSDSTMREEVARRLYCFIDSARFRSDELELFHTAASVDIALDALRSWPSTDRLRLHMFDKLQTFFVLVCYLLCTPNDSKNSEAAKASCNEAVRNSANFQMAFNCARGSPMNPAKKCSLFSALSTFRRA